MNEENVPISKPDENGGLSFLLSLPESWAQIIFNETIENISTIGKKIKQRDYLDTGRFPVFDQGQDFIGGYTNDESNIVECDLPIIIFGDHTKVVKFVDTPFAPGADGVKVLRPNAFFDPKLFFYFTQVLANIITSKGYARHFQYLSKSIIPLAPLPEQHRIVAKIEQLFSELDKGVAELKKAREMLASYRQSLLKAAFEGRLTEKWRKEHVGELEPAEQLLVRIEAEREKRYQQQVKEWKKAVKQWETQEKPGRKPSKPRKPKELPSFTKEELAELSELPEGWIWVRSGALFESVTSGSRGWAKYYSSKGAIFIRITNMDFDSLNLDLAPEKIQYVKPPGNVEGVRTRIEEGDFLFSITGYLGMFAIAPNLKEAYVNQHIALVRPLSGFRRKFVGYYIVSESGGRFHLEKQRKGAVKAGLSLDDIQLFPIPICSFEEQSKIVDNLNSKLENIDNFTQVIDHVCAEADLLRQSILKKAFSGKLVPQDPKDEPASELLKRIKAERDKAAKEKKANRKTPKKREKIQMADLLTVLKQAGDWISAQEAFRQCGISDGAETDRIEALYMELRDFVKAEKVDYERRGEEDWLKLKTTQEDQDAS